MAAQPARIRILGISGSLRAQSCNTALLRALSALAPDSVEISVYGGLGDLPLFNPDLQDVEPHAVTDFRARLRTADGILIASPEYAHGVTGAIKNALDWVVGGEEFVNKPVAILNASPRATHALAALKETVSVMSGRIIAEASIAVPLLGSNLDVMGIIAHPEISDLLRGAISAFADAIATIQAETDS